MRKRGRPKLYPGHQHEWTGLPDWYDLPDVVSCIICGFWAPRNAAKLDSTMADVRCPVRLGNLAGAQCLDHQGHLGDHQYPEQETRTDA